MADSIDSRMLYYYLCEKVGTEKVVKSRRTFFKVKDWSENNISIPLESFSSGSKAEGLDLPGSDLDIMYIDKINVIRTELSETRHLLRQDFELYFTANNTPPGFARIIVRLPVSDINNRYINIGGIDVELFETENGLILPNTPLKTVFMDFGYFPIDKHPMENLFVSHGPCSSTKDGEFDLMFCLRLDEWPQEAFEWITRHRVHDWPPEDLITDILNNNNSVLLVPIGSKFGAPEDNPHEWRISFSVAEQMLVHSFNHTQILCYAMLKILLKQVIDKEGAANLLCSYFMKTLLFWLIEETGIYMWKPDNLFKCFQACLKRLIYHIQLKHFPNYFIRQNNMFEGKITGKSEAKLRCILHNIYIEGIRCFLRTETLKDFITPHPTYPISEIEWGQYDEDKAIYPLLKYISLFGLPDLSHRKIYFYISAIKSNFIRRLLTLQFAKASIQTAAGTKYDINVSNKHCYRQYKFSLPYLLLGTHFNINAWLLLVAFFYQHKQYHNTLSIADFVCSEIRKRPNIIRPHTIQPEKYTFFKAGFFLQRYKASCVIPIQIPCLHDTVFSKCDFCLDTGVEVRDNEELPPVCLFDESLCPLGHFMRIMCFNHLHDLANSHTALCDLQQLIDNTDVTSDSVTFVSKSLCLLLRAYEISNTVFPFRNLLKIKDVLLSLDNQLIRSIITDFVQNGPDILDIIQG